MSDKLFILSADEAEQFTTDEQRRGGNWWLRSPGNGRCNLDYMIAGLVSGAVIDRYGEIVCNDWGVRPAMYLDTASKDAYLQSILNSGRKEFHLGKFHDEPISWYLLNKETGLCVTTKTLYLLPFDENQQNNYELSNVRQHLQEDYKRFFNAQERAMIAEVMVDGEKVVLVPVQERHSEYESMVVSRERGEYLSRNKPRQYMFPRENDAR